MWTSLLCSRAICKSSFRSKGFHWSSGRQGQHMNWSASVLSTVTSDTEPAIVITFDTGKYIFNAGENTGRSWLQSRRTWRKARGIFMTSVGTERSSGLAGLLMFFADAGMKGMDVVGPPGTMHYMASMRNYLYRVTMSFNCTEAPSAPVSGETTVPAPVYTDENIILYAIPLRQQDASEDAIEAQMSSVSAKRKRSPSPKPPSSKRPALEDAVHRNGDSGSVSSLAVPLPFLEQIRQPGFSPLILQGADAREWRRLTIQNMFPLKPAPPQVYEPKNQNNDSATEKPPLSVVQSPLPTLMNAAAQHKEKRLPLFSFDGGISRKPHLCYVLVGPRVRGKFDVAKAEALGVGPGPARAQLTKGMSVTVIVDDEHGNKVERVVNPEDCVGPSDNPQVVIVTDVPTPGHIPDLAAAFAQNPFYAQFRSKVETGCQYNVHAVFHLCGPGVLEDERYKAFMRGFANKVHHFVSSKEHGADPATFTSAAYTQLRLNQLDRDMFPNIHFRTHALRELSEIEGLPPNVELLKANRLIDVRPARAPVHDTQAQAYDHFHPATERRSRVYLPPHIYQAYKTIKKQVLQTTEKNTRVPRPGDDVEIIPLGTSSALPSKYRNVSSTMIRIPGRGSILLDCGEGTWGQLVRLYGDDPARTTGVWEVIRDLKCIFLSHMHGDHHIGLTKVLAMRAMMRPAPTEPLYVVGLRNAHLYIQEQGELEDLGLSRDDGNGVIMVLSDVLHWKGLYPNPYPSLNITDEQIESHREVAGRMCSALGLQSFQTVDVYHRTRCFGVVLKHHEGWSIVFSADTMPTNNLVRAGQNATLLIHEATMADNQEEMARDKAHSTFRQAIDVGKRMNAENVLLTHFSARYPKMPPVERSPPSSPSRGNERRPTLALALDLAKIRIGDMWKLSAYIPAIERNFLETAAEEGDEEDDTTTATW